MAKHAGIDTDSGMSYGSRDYGMKGKKAKKKSILAVGPTMPGAKGQDVNPDTYTSEFRSNDGGCQLGHNPDSKLAPPKG